MAMVGAEGGGGAWAGLIAAFTSATFGVADTKGACTCKLGFWGATGAAFLGFLDNKGTRPILTTNHSST